MVSGIGGDGKRSVQSCQATIRPRVKGGQREEAANTPTHICVLVVRRGCDEDGRGGGRARWIKHANQEDGHRHADADGPRHARDLLAKVIQNGPLRLVVAIG